MTKKKKRDDKKTENKKTENKNEGKKKGEQKLRENGRKVVSKNISQSPFNSIRVMQETRPLIT